MSPIRLEVKGGFAFNLASYSFSLSQNFHKRENATKEVSAPILIRSTLCMELSQQHNDQYGIGYIKTERLPGLDFLLLFIMAGAVEVEFFHPSNIKLFIT
jgi:hypothetical protein